MALTKQQRDLILKNLGFLDGLGWVFVLDEQYMTVAEALDAVCGDLSKVLDEDGGAEG